MTQPQLRIAAVPSVPPVPEAEPVRAVIHVRLAPAAPRRGFEDYLRTLAYVLRAWQLTGAADYELLVACPVVADLDGMLACLRRCGGVTVTSAALVLREVSGRAEPGSAYQGPMARDGRRHARH